MRRVKGKVALVTGGASGIGRACAVVLAREGAKVAIADLSDRDSATVLEEIGGGAIFVKLDVTDEKQWLDAIARTLEAFGKLDILVIPIL